MIFHRVDGSVEQTVISEETDRESTRSGKSLMWQRKSKGPSTVPCGTPEPTSTWRDFSPR